VPQSHGILCWGWGESPKSGSHPFPLAKAYLQSTSVSMTLEGSGHDQRTLQGACKTIQITGSRQRRRSKALQDLSRVRAAPCIAGRRNDDRRENLSGLSIGAFPPQEGTNTNHPFRDTRQAPSIPHQGC
jgi:hypothetical protein